MPVEVPRPRLYLASRSPRRRELLAQIGVAFDTLVLRNPPRDVCELDESPLAAEDPIEYVQRIARRKAEHGWSIVEWRKLPPQAVLAADTPLEQAGELLDTARDAHDAGNIMRRLSGKGHRVLSAVAVAHSGRIETVLSVSEVRFRVLEEEEIARYVASGEPMDKAGAYGIQGRAGMFVEHLAGSYSGVMGLPLCETAQLLKCFSFRL